MAENAEFAKRIIKMRIKYVLEQSQGQILDENNAMTRIGRTIMVIEYLINFDRQTLRRCITQTIDHLDGEAKCAPGGWLADDNPGDIH